MNSLTKKLLLVLAVALAACTSTGQSCVGKVETCEGKQAGMACEADDGRTGKCMPDEERGKLTCFADGEAPDA